MIHNGVDPSEFFASAQLRCARCGQQNDFGSRKRLYFANGSQRCTHCGFLFIEHLLRKISKMREMIASDPEWRALLRAGRHAEVQRRLEALVPIETDGAGPPTPNS